MLVQVMQFFFDVMVQVMQKNFASLGITGFENCNKRHELLLKVSEPIAIHGTPFMGQKDSAPPKKKDIKMHRNRKKNQKVNI